MRMIPFFYSILLYAPLFSINFTTYNVYNILVSSRLHQNAVERVDPCHKRTVTIGENTEVGFLSNLQWCRAGQRRSATVFSLPEITSTGDKYL